MALRELHDVIDTISLTTHLKNMPFGVLLWDEHMKLVYCSFEAAAMFGYVSDELLQKPTNLLQFVHDDDAPAVAALITEITSGRTIHNEGQNRNVTKHGKTIYCRWYNSALKNDSGQVINILSLCEDVTVQVETQLALTKSQQLHSLAFNSAIDPMWLIHVEGNNAFRFETINAAFTEVTGWTPAQVEGQPIENILPPTSHVLVREKYNEALTTGKIVDYIEEALHPSGIKYGEIRVIPIRGEAGDFVRILGIAHDITEKVSLQKKLDAEREINNRQITSAAIRGQEIERSKVSRELHDNVNQVLTTVKLYVELCMDKKIDSATILPKCTTLLNDTINEIRSLSKQLSAPSTGKINFKETLAELMESLRSSMQVVVHFDFESLPFLEMESELHLAIYRVTQEQITNIIKYSKAKRVNVSLTVKNDILHFTITDDGIGFDPMQKRQGIGITNMQSRVEILNGSFKIISYPGEGTRLEIEIPVIIRDHICYAEQTGSNYSVY